MLNNPQGLICHKTPNKKPNWYKRSREPAVGNTFFYSEMALSKSLRNISSGGTIITLWDLGTFCYFIKSKKTIIERTALIWGNSTLFLSSSHREINFQNYKLQTEAILLQTIADAAEVKKIGIQYVLFYSILPNCDWLIDWFYFILESFHWTRFLQTNKRSRHQKRLVSQVLRTGATQLQISLAILI